MILGDLKTQVRQVLFPFGEGENLVAAHDAFFLAALNDLQDAVICLKQANTDSYPQCSSYFNCGMTVIPAPRGQIKSLYTIGKKSSSDGSVSDGTEVGSIDIPATDNQLLILVDGQLVNPDPTVRDVATVPDDGLYTVNVSQLNPTSTLYPVNAPQYFRTEIIYTDTNGTQKTIQPAPLLHMNFAANSGSAIISAKAGSIVSCRVSSFNIPQNDGGIEVKVSVVKGTQVNDEDWCSKVYYDRVDYCHLERYGRICARKTSGIRAIGDALINGIFGFGGFRPKTSYPAPTDAGYESLTALPQGFHYPQSSTDAGGRARHGVYAVHHGRIYVAPWIESAETLVVEYVGKKITWTDGDTVDDDQKFKKAVTEFVGREHYTYYEENEQKLQHFTTNYALTIRELVNDCRNRNRSIACEEAGTSLSAASGVGSLSGVSTATFYNEVQSYTATCPAGQSGQPVTSTVGAGQIASALSVADANARALAQATADAQSKLQCNAGSGIFLNTVQTFAASCPAASGTTPAAIGTPVTVTIPAGSYQSSVSQELADAAALNAAMSQANAQLSCVFYNAPQTVQATCPDGSTGTTQSATVAASQFTDTTQAGVDAKASAEAQRQASNLLSCSITTFQIGNTAQQANKTGSIIPPGCSSVFTYNITSIVPQGTYVAQATTATQSAIQASLNAQANAAAQSQVNFLYTQQYNQFVATCNIRRAGTP